MSPDFKTIKYEKIDMVAVITLNRPDRLNAIDLQMNIDLKAALKEAKEDEGVRAIVITGAGRAFCAGADVRQFASGEFSERVAGGNPTIHPDDFFKNPKPIIAAVNGVAVGFGTNLCLSCDIIYASEKASFGEFFIRMGIIPDMNGSFLLPLTVGVHKAKELIFSGDRIFAEEALRIRLVNKVFPHEELMPKAMELANKLATPIETLELTVRSSNCLESRHIETVGELVKMTEADLLKVRSFGKTSLREIGRKLADMGLSLGMTNVD